MNKNKTGCDNCLKEFAKEFFETTIDFFISKYMDLKNIIEGIDYPKTKEGIVLKPFMGCIFEEKK